MAVVSSEECVNATQQAVRSDAASRRRTTLALCAFRAGVMRFTVKGTSDASYGKLPTLCPHCGREGTFDPIGKGVNIGDGFIAGQSACPNAECKGHIFIVAKKGQIFASYPAVLVDFDATSVPDGVKTTFEEALQCHANSCFVASAIMVRRTLEEICHERDAKGSNLKARIKDLESKIVLPKELIEALDELRLLGNDAAHIEAMTFKSVSKAELDVAIEFTKEIIKGLYQYSALLDKIRSLQGSDT